MLVFYLIPAGICFFFAFSPIWRRSQLLKRGVEVEAQIIDRETSSDSGSVYVLRYHVEGEEKTIRVSDVDVARAPKIERDGDYFRRMYYDPKRPNKALLAINVENFWITARAASIPLVAGIAFPLFYFLFGR